MELIEENEEKVIIECDLEELKIINRLIVIENLEEY